MKTAKIKSARFDATEGAGLRRLRRAKNADAIREAVINDQREARGATAPKIVAFRSGIQGRCPMSQ
jgi:hypothetical protein